MPGSSDTNVKLVFALFGLISTITLGIASFALVWMFQTHADLQVLQAAVDAVVADHETDIRQDGTLVKHWRLHNWERTEINRLQDKMDLPISNWPDLD